MWNPPSPTSDTSTPVRPSFRCGRPPAAAGAPPFTAPWPARPPHAVSGTSVEAAASSRNSRRVIRAPPPRGKMRVARPWCESAGRRERARGRRRALGPSRSGLRRSPGEPQTSPPPFASHPLRARSRGRSSPAAGRTVGERSRPSAYPARGTSVCAKRRCRTKRPDALRPECTFMARRRPGAGRAGWSRWKTDALRRDRPDQRAARRRPRAARAGTVTAAGSRTGPDPRLSAATAPRSPRSDTARITARKVVTRASGRGPSCRTGRARAQFLGCNRLRVGRRRASGRCLGVAPSPGDRRDVSGEAAVRVVHVGGEAAAQVECRPSRRAARRRSRRCAAARASARGTRRARARARRAPGTRCPP